MMLFRQMMRQTIDDFSVFTAGDHYNRSVFENPFRVPVKSIVGLKSISLKSINDDHESFSSSDAPSQQMIEFVICDVFGIFTIVQLISDERRLCEKDGEPTFSNQISTCKLPIDMDVQLAIASGRVPERFDLKLQGRFRSEFRGDFLRPLSRREKIPCSSLSVNSP